jgi:hypothetical protein
MKEHSEGPCSMSYQTSTALQWWSGVGDGVLLWMVLKGPTHATLVKAGLQPACGSALRPVPADLRTARPCMRQWAHRQK